MIVVVLKAFVQWHRHLCQQVPIDQQLNNCRRFKGLCPVAPSPLPTGNYRSATKGLLSQMLSFKGICPVAPLPLPTGTDQQLNDCRHRCRC